MDNSYYYRKTLVNNLSAFGVKVIGFAMAGALMVTARGMIGPEAVSVYELLLALSAIVGSYMLIYYVPSYRNMMIIDAVIGIGFSLVMLYMIHTGDKRALAQAFYYMIIILAPLDIFFQAQKSRTRDRLLSEEHKQFLDDYRTTTQISMTVAALVGSSIAAATLNSGSSELVIGGLGIALILIGDIMAIAIWNKYGKHIVTHKDDLWGKKGDEEKNNFKAVLKRLYSI